MKKNKNHWIDFINIVSQYFFSWKKGNENSINILQNKLKTFIQNKQNERINVTQKVFFIDSIIPQNVSAFLNEVYAYFETKKVKLKEDDTLQKNENLMRYIKNDCDFIFCIFWHYIDIIENYFENVKILIDPIEFFYYY